MSSRFQPLTRALGVTLGAVLLMVSPTAHAGPIQSHDPAPGLSAQALTTQALADVSFTDAQHGWVLGGFFMANTANGGKTWKQRHLSKWLPQPYTLYSICATSSKRAWLVADNGIFHTKNSGKTWTRKAKNVSPTPTYDVNWHNCAFVNDSTGWISGGATIIYTNDAGKTWNRQNEANSITSNGLSNIAPIDATRAFAGMNSVGGHIVMGVGMGGVGWSQLGSKPFLQFNEYANPTISGAAATNPNTFWVAATTGEVFRSLNQGVEWSDAVNGPVGTGVLRSVGIEAMGNTIISFGLNNSNQAAAVTSVDGGTAWQWSNVAAGTILGFGAVDLVSAMVGWAVAGTNVLHTVDGGQSWQVVG